jgi:hypothetical protein
LHLLDLIILIVDQLVFRDDLLLGFGQLLLASLELFRELVDLKVFFLQLCRKCLLTFLKSGFTLQFKEFDLHLLLLNKIVILAQ